MEIKHTLRKVAAAILGKINRAIAVILLVSQASFELSEEYPGVGLECGRGYGWTDI